VNDTGKASFKLPNNTVENHRPLKVIVIGAGYSGIYCGIRIPERLRNVELVIYEKNAGVGGTWYENRYELEANKVIWWNMGKFRGRRANFG
jgi:cation diffusion facilitator CzcD-associated flavoprotein CzcO